MRRLIRQPRPQSYILLSFGGWGGELGAGTIRVREINRERGCQFIVIKDSYIYA